jgi:hypothetical protein
VRRRTIRWHHQHFTHAATATTIATTTIATTTIAATTATATTTAHTLLILSASVDCRSAVESLEEQKLQRCLIASVALDLPAHASG